MVTLAQQLEQLAGLGIFLVAATLTALSVVAWRRERERRVAVVAAAYAVFAVHGFVTFAEYLLLEYGVLSFGTVELLEHASSFLVLFGLVIFFVALTWE